MDWSKEYVNAAISLRTIIILMICVVTFAWPLGSQGGTKSLGQQLVDEVASKHRPQLIYLGLHGVTPHSKNSVIFASTDSGKIGKKSSCADLHVVDKGIPVMEMKENHDGAGTTVG